MLTTTTNEGKQTNCWTSRGRRLNPYILSVLYGRPPINEVRWVKKKTGSGLVNQFLVLKEAHSIFTVFIQTLRFPLGKLHFRVNLRLHGMFCPSGPAVFIKSVEVDKTCLSPQNLVFRYRSLLDFLSVMESEFGYIFTGNSYTLGQHKQKLKNSQNVWILLRPPSHSLLEKIQTIFFVVRWVS